MYSQRTLIKICLQNKEDVFLVSEYEPQNKLTLQILDIKQNKSYVGQASDLDLRTQAAKIRLTYRDFIDKAIKALFQTSANECDFIYSLDEENENYIFKWKSIDDEETIINLGGIPMTQQDHVSVFSGVLLSLSKGMLELNSKIKSLSSDLEESKDQTTKTLNQLTEAIDAKENLEREMFAKFVLVLNEKKRKIREMQCSSGSSNPSRNTTAIRKAPKQKPKQSKLNLISSSEEEADGNFDISKPGPSTSTKRNSLLFLDDEDESVVPVRPSKIRNRKAVSKRKCSSPEQLKSNPKPVPSTLMDDDSDDFLLDNL